MNDIAKIADYSIEIDGVPYSMTKLPAPDSKIVKAEHDRVLMTIKLEKLVSGLARTGDLINLAYNATPSKFGNLRAPIGKLHDRFGNLCRKCMEEMGSVAEATRAILPNITRVFTFLLDGKEDIAITLLSRCSTQAQQLSESMSGLATEFDGLADDTVTALGSAEIERGGQQQKAQELREKAADIEAKTKEATTLVEKLAEAKQQLQKLYEEAKEKAESSENRAFALSMVGAIMKPLGEGLGAFASAYGQSQNPLSRLTPPPTPKPEKDTKTPAKDTRSKEELEIEKDSAAKVAETAKKTSEEATKAADAAKASVKTADETLTKATAAASNAKDEPSKKAAASELATAQTKKLEAESVAKSKTEAAAEAENKLKEADKKVALLEAALKGLGKAISDAGDGISQAGNDYTKIAEGYRQEKLKYLDLLVQKQDREREALANIQRYAIEMKNAGEQEQTAEVAAAALFQAIGALKQVVVVLRDAALFWSNMAEHCKRLANPEMKKDIIDFKDLDRETKLEVYREDNFKTSVVTYYAGWMALQAIASEYMAATEKVRAKVLADYGTYLDDNAAKELGVKLAAQLLGYIQNDLQANDEMKAGIEDALKAAKAEAPPAIAA